MNHAFHTLLLAQAIGLYLFIMAIIMLSRAEYYRNMLTHINAGDSKIFSVATSSLAVGIFLVLIHNIWIWESEVLVTMIGWLVLIKSVICLSFPESMANLCNKVYAGWGYYAVAGITGIVGMLLISHGFYLFL